MLKKVEVEETCPFAHYLKEGEVQAQAQAQTEGGREREGGRGGMKKVRKRVNSAPESASGVPCRSRPGPHERSRL